MNTLLLLIDFYGHPALTTDDTSDSVRYSQLNKIVSSTQIDRDKFTINKLLYCCYALIFTHPLVYKFLCGLIFMGHPVPQEVSKK